MQKSIFTEELQDLKNYDSFATASKEKINRYLNVILWFCTFTGPALAIGIKLGVFSAIGYDICVFISIYVAAVSFLHHLIIKKWPASVLSGMFALLTMDILLVLMAYAHVSIYLTWFLIPLISLLFVDWKIFHLFVFVNYGCMFFSTWQTSAYNASHRPDFDNTMQYFLNQICGFTIETAIMFAAAVALGKVVTHYFSNLIDNYRDLDKRKEQLIRDEQQIKEYMMMLESMAGIYEHVNLLDFHEMTEMPLHDAQHTKRNIDFHKQTQTFMNLQLNDNIVENQLTDFKSFTDITTVQKRLAGKKVIAKEFMDKNTGWFRAQYINIDPQIDGIPGNAIYTVQNIDKDKRKEEHLIQIAITDELTGLYNRRCFDNDAEEYQEKPMEEDLVLISIDVNGLKTANDTLGHSAGDELIIGAAFCIQLTFGTYGKVYRTGGDEFIAMIHTDDCDFIQETIEMMAGEWVGKEVDSLSISVGYAAHRDYPQEDIAGLVKIADAMMYAEKEKHYHQSGKERRRQ